MSSKERNPGLYTASREPGPQEEAPEGDSGSHNKKKGRALDKERKDAVSPDTPKDLQKRQRVIGTELRRMFDEVVNEPVPAEMLELLRRIDQQKAD